MEVYDIYDFSFHNTEDRHGLRPDNDIRFYAFFVPFAAMTLFEKQSQIYGSEFKVQGLVVKAKRSELKKQSQFAGGQNRRKILFELRLFFSVICGGLWPLEIPLCCFP